MAVAECDKSILIENQREQLEGQICTACLAEAANQSTGILAEVVRVCDFGLEQIDQPPKEPRVIGRLVPDVTAAELNVKRIRDEHWEELPMDSVQVNVACRVRLEDDGKVFEPHRVRTVIMSDCIHAA